MLYNKSGTPFYKAAHRIRASSQPILNELEHLSSSSAVRSGITNGDESTTAEPQSSLIGDLEPPLELLELLFSEEAVKDDIDIILNNQPLISLFNYEFAKLKPPPPPPTPPPPKPAVVKAPKRKAGRPKKAAADKEADAQLKATINVSKEELDAAPGFRAPRTRGALAAEAELGTEDEAKAGKKGPKLKDSPTVSRGQSNLPPMVDDVDKQRSFKMFNDGWILPPDQKRGGRTRVDRSTLPPPRKRQRTGWCSRGSAT
jgi:hypothetical protein